MIDDSKIAQSADPMVDAPFCLGDPSKGFDCLNSLRQFYDRMGFDFPLQFKDWNESNYPKKWKDDPDEGRKILGEFLSTLGTEINPNYMARGDLLIFSGKELSTFPGIFLGNDNVLMVFDKGVRIVPLRFFKSSLKGVRRLIE